MHNKITFKNNLKLHAQSVIQQRIQTAKLAIANAQQAANSEEKSSAGDKYETGRAMGHLQKDMYARQLAENIKELSALNAVTTNMIYGTVSTGSFIQCNTICFFIACGLGKQIIDNQSIFFLSPQAPLAHLLQGKKTGDQFLFNKQTVVINDVY